MSAASSTPPAYEAPQQNSEVSQMAAANQQTDAFQQMQAGNQPQQGQPAPGGIMSPASGQLQQQAPTAAQAVQQTKQGTGMMAQPQAQPQSPAQQIQAQHPTAQMLASMADPKTGNGTVTKFSSGGQQYSHNPKMPSGYQHDGPEGKA